MKLQNHISKQGSPQQPISRTFQMVALSLSPDQLELVALSRDLQHAGAFCSPGFCANRNWFCPQEVNSNRKIPSLINPSFPTQFPTIKVALMASWHSSGTKTLSAVPAFTPTRVGRPTAGNGSAGHTSTTIGRNQRQPSIGRTAKFLS